MDKISETTETQLPNDADPGLRYGEKVVNGRVVNALGRAAERATRPLRDYDSRPVERDEV